MSSRHDTSRVADLTKEKLPSSLMTGELRGIAETKITPSHPVEIIERKNPKEEWNSKLRRLEAVYGKHAVFRRRMDASLLRRFQRLPGLRSEFSGLNTLLGNDEKLNLSDVLDVPSHRPERSVNTRLVMESYLKM